MTKNELRKYAEANMIPVYDFVANINDALKKHTQVWQEISTTLDAACELYGHDSKEFKHILNAFKEGYEAEKRAFDEELLDE